MWTAGVDNRGGGRPLNVHPWWTDVHEEEFRKCKVETLREKFNFIQMSARLVDWDMLYFKEKTMRRTRNKKMR